MNKYNKTEQTITWGEDPELFGPKDWYRNSLLISELRRRLKKGSILDYGCGSGICMSRLQKYPYSLIGIDITEENVRYIRRKFNNVSNIRVYQGDETTLQQLSGYVDAIICGETMEHIKNDRRLVRLFKKVLAPGGYIVLSVPAHQSLWSPIDVFAGHYRRYEKDKLRSLFLKNGFEIEKVFYWGFPLGVIWDTVISDPIMRKKIASKAVYTNSKSFLGYFMQFTIIKVIISMLFYIDSLLFFDDRRGNGLMLVARKRV
jgi:SAM-dependent methyltransferase